ncbi:MAG: B12-binding domain-containing radical SAM protein [candidate division Zixibacteria bacterium]|nr:B12-binding domain-containing radical SAM protein [candidate division Zixibacteria bacterium]
MVKQNRVVFFYPIITSNQFPLHPPLEVLALSTVLKKYGYKPTIIDQRLKQDWYTSADLEDLNDILYIGISCRLGLQAQEGLKFAKWIRSINPKIPLIWGGWGPSTAPELFIVNENVDCVIVGQADEVIVPLTEAIQNKTGYESIPGAVYLSTNSNEIMQNPRKLISNLDATPPMAYDLVNMHDYLSSGKIINYMSSRGCTGECEFCAINHVHQSNYSALQSSRVIEEIKQLIKTYSLTTLQFVDTNFFDIKERALEIAQGFIRNKFNINWSAYARADQLNKYSDEELSIFDRSGCRMVAIGIEAGNQKLLNDMKKNTSVDDNYTVVSRLKNTKIKIWALMILGLPHETYKDFGDSIDMAIWIKKENPSNIISFSPYCPPPDSELIEQAIGSSYKQSEKNLENFTKIFIPHIYLLRNKMSWLAKNHESAIKYFIGTYAPIYFQNDIIRNRDIISRLLLTVLRLIAMFRIKYKYFKFPMLWWLQQTMKAFNNKYK